MNQSINKEINDIIAQLKLHRFNSELEYNSKQLNMSENPEMHQINARCSKLETIIASSLESKNVKDDAKEFITNIDQLVYKYPWKKLPEFHKNVKLLEYIKEKYNIVLDDVKLTTRLQNGGMIAEVLLTPLSSAAFNSKYP